MNVGDKVLAEGVVNMVGEGFCRIAFARVGAQAVTHVRVQDENLRPVPANVGRPAKIKAPTSDD